jgi:hypothetical protein
MAFLAFSRSAWKVVLNGSLDTLVAPAASLGYALASLVFFVFFPDFLVSLAPSSRARPARADLTASFCSTYSFWKKPEKMFLGGKGGLCPPILATIIFNRPENRAWVFSPPKYLVRDRNVSPICYRMPQNTIKTPQNAAKRRKTPQNAAKRRKTPQNAAKRRK